jgi:hypothetical protein
MVAEAKYILDRPDLPGQPNTPPGGDWPVEDAHPVILGDEDNIPAENVPPEED